MFRRDREYAKIHIEVNSKKFKNNEAIVEGDEVTISAVIGALIHNLIEDGFDRDILEFAVKKGLEDSKKKGNHKKIQIKEIHIDEENEKEFKELLEKIMKGDK